MTDNFKVMAGKAFDDARRAAHHDAAVAAHKTIRSAGAGALTASDDGRTGAHTAVADAGIAAHAAVSKKREEVKHAD